MASLMFCSTFLLVAGVVAFTLNGSIVLINMSSLRNGAKLSPSDVIHVAMGVVTIALLGHFLGLWLSVSYSAISFYIIVLSLPFLVNFTFWLTAWLCAFYCTSITTFSHPVFTWMKRCLTTFLPYLLVSTGLGSLVINVPAIWIFYMKITEQNCVNGTLLVTSVEIISKGVEYNVLVNLLRCCLPFLVILVSLITSVSSLLRHVQTMKQNNPECLRPKLQSHIKAIRTMVMLLILSAIFYIAENILYSSKSLNDVEVVISWCLIFVSITGEAIVIIQASQKLRKIFLGVFCPAKLVNNIRNLRTLNPKPNAAG